MPTSRRAQAADPNAQPGPRTLKKYPNRRLYDTRSSSYITLADVKRMVMGGEQFEVRDAKTGDDLTRSILLQIILEEESGGVPMFSTEMLAQIIRFYGSAMQGPMGAMLEQNLKAFVEMQQQFVGGKPPVFPNLMTSYLDQSRAVFEAMQDQMAVFGRFPPGKR
ncbi:polyhydroxyalkanoate synthesis repressor PhaR [Rubrivivax sp. JA1026]|uniref:polyhydroxyalkanoate synthesis repressor PhaR n=1 Tax=Rubrivivax sp. JA1026 TaxID=2710888 RepID=UPI0013E91DBF|nr:polyhydroxyalkanoate synthesis repressor PhaR [Rubrivivax sp. JA1026]